MNLAYKILSTKLKSGELVAGQQIGIQIDQTLTQDSTGTMAYLQLEAMGIEHVAVEKAVAYIDHNMLQTGFENMDDHEVAQEEVCIKFLNHDTHTWRGVYGAGYLQ